MEVSVWSRPRWFTQDQNYRALGVICCLPEKGKLELCVAGRSTLLINPYDSKSREHWLVEWSVLERAYPNWMTNGRRLLSIQDLSAAFGQTNAHTLQDAEFIARFEADAGKIGLYLRKGDYLNIPGPGTGELGDPNLSLVLTSEIKESVLKIIRGSDN